MGGGTNSGVWSHTVRRQILVTKFNTKYLSLTSVARVDFEPHRPIANLTSRKVSNDVCHVHHVLCGV